jgi:hypothetical protein
MKTPAEQAMLAARAAAALAITPASMAKELEAVRDKISRGLNKLTELSEEDLAIATVPRDEVWREDMVRLYRSGALGAHSGHVCIGRALSDDRSRSGPLVPAQVARQRLRRRQVAKGPRADTRRLVQGAQLSR